MYYKEMVTPLDPHCPVGRALKIIGERWTILILRDMFIYGPRKFSDWEQALPAIAPSTLSKRIKTLEHADLIERRSYSTHPPRYEYVLTSKGKALGPALKALKNWGEKYT